MVGRQPSINLFVKVRLLTEDTQALQPQASCWVMSQAQQESYYTSIASLTNSTVNAQRSNRIAENVQLRNSV